MHYLAQCTACANHTDASLRFNQKTWARLRTHNRQIDFSRLTRCERIVIGRKTFNPWCNCCNLTLIWHICDARKNINSNLRVWKSFGKMTWRWQANRWYSSMIGNNCAHTNQCNIILSWYQLEFGVHDDARYTQYCGCYIWIAVIVNAQLNFDVVRWKSLLRKKQFLGKYSNERRTRRTNWSYPISVMAAEIT